VLLASHGSHPFFEGEEHFKDAREEPIKYAGYSISAKRGTDGRWRPSVRIHPDRYRELRAYFDDLAIHRTVEALSHELRRIPFEPYGPVKVQLRSLLRAVNRARKIAGLEQVPPSALRLSRKGVRPFAYPELKDVA